MTASLRRSLRLGKSKKMIFAINYHIHALPKIFLVDVTSGSVEISSSSPRLELAVPKRCSSSPDGLLQWFQEYVRRLEEGIYAPGELHPESGPITQGIRLFATCGPTFSSCVTRGVECTGSSIYMPGEQQGWTYSISFRLVGTAAERGFETCQLYKRKWKITEDGKAAREVEGEGVVGFFPILTDGGWLLNRESDPHGQYALRSRFVSGAFRYQSASGRFRSMRGSFAGDLEFHPGTKANPTGPPFYVKLEPFRLDVPEFKY